MENLIGKAVIFMICIGFLSTGVARCSIDMESGAKFLRGVGGAMLGTGNSEVDKLGQQCTNGICVDTLPRDLPARPSAIPGRRQ